MEVALARQSKVAGCAASPCFSHKDPSAYSAEINPLAGGRRTLCKKPKFLWNSVCTCRKNNGTPLRSSAHSDASLSVFGQSSASQHTGASHKAVGRELGSSSESIKEQGGHLFCFGFGYTTLGLANTLKKQGWHVTGTCRSEEKKETLCARGLPAVVFDTDGDIEGLESDGLAALRSATHLIASIPPVGDFDQDPALALHAPQIRAAASDNLKWIGYLSTTGVYGDWNGDWVDESTTPRPTNPRTVARLRAEEAWLSLGKEANIPVCIFRLGGIYGPSRSALDSVQSGRPSSQSQRVRESRRFTSRCHVADIVQVLTSAMTHPGAGGQIFNVVDDDPAPRQEVIAYARQLLSKQEQSSERPETAAENLHGSPPGNASESLPGASSDCKRLGGGEKGGESEAGPFDEIRPSEDNDSVACTSDRLVLKQGRVNEGEIGDPREELGSYSCSEQKTDGGPMKTTADLAAEDKSPTKMIRMVDEKRVRNTRIKRALGVTLTFPTYREGLAAIARGDAQPFNEVDKV